MRAAVLSIVLLAGCNQLLGVDDVTSDDPDAGDDGGPVSSATRAGIVTLFDVTVTDPEATDCCGGLRGGTLRARFEDLTQHGGEVIYGTSAVDGCLLTRHDASHLPHPELDGGPITIGGDGLLKTVGPCTFLSPTGYACFSADAGGATVTATAPTAGVVTFHLEGADFSNQDLIGSHLLIQGFADPLLQGAFPIVAQPASDVLTASVPGIAMGASEVSTGGIQYGVINAAAPSPVQPGLDQDFLGGASSTITVTKPADLEDAPEIAFTTYPRGEGYELDMLSTAPDAFPTTAQDVRYSCDRTGGKCGAEGAAPDGVVEATVVLGRATRSPTAGLFAFDMPYEAPGAEYLDLRCVYPSSDAATIPAAAVQQILDFAPTRIEIQVARVTMVTIADPANAGNLTDVLVGHALIGHTDP